MSPAYGEPVEDIAPRSIQAFANKLLEEVLTGETADETPVLVERAEFLSGRSTGPSWTIPPRAFRLSRSPAV
ncbi:hypothetical protein ASD99_21730 [Mesorhizobium sp. Root695]|nr:hypothetical protein ASD99_21730 [Mesorhizobium sp. Root695]